MQHIEYTLTEAQVVHKHIYHTAGEISSTVCSKIMHIILYATDAVKLHHFYGFMELCTVYTVT